MKLFKKFPDFERFEMSWQRLLVQGVVILSLGFILALASALQPDAIVMSAYYFSWLPICGMIILSLGLLECLDALLATEQRDFFQNLQVGTFDTVVGSLIIFSISDTPVQLNLMVAAFLLVRGIVRIVLVYALRLPYKLFTLACGVISVLTGLMILMVRPEVEGWFLSLCLSIEIGFRGWAMITFALWVKRQKQLLHKKL
jgi:uncharacterized membrane protein HdeD (DUF308 family)